MLRESVDSLYEEQEGVSIGMLADQIAGESIQIATITGDVNNIMQD